MIVDSASADGARTHRVPPLDPEQRRAWWAVGGRRDVADLEPVYRFVADHCEAVEEVDGATIYRCHY
jgi:hypothetical protein